MNSPPDLCVLFNMRAGYRMIYAANMSKSGGPDGPRQLQTPAIIPTSGVMSEASMRAYVPDGSEFEQQRS